jgi:hypothetical protein
MAHHVEAAPAPVPQVIWLWYKGNKNKKNYQVPVIYSFFHVPNNLHCEIKKNITF